MIPGIAAQSIAGTPLTAGETVGTGAGLGGAFGVGYSASALGTATGTGAATATGTRIATAGATAAGTGAATAVGAAGAFATFNGATSNVTLSNGNLTVTHANATAAAGARSATTKTTGKYYFEITWTLSNNTNDAAGLLRSSGTFASVNPGIECFLIYPSGNIYSNGSSTGTSLSAIAAGTVLCFAIDLTARKGWIRKGGGNWNNSGTANPATGVGGLTMYATNSFDPAVSFGGAAGSNMTGNFGATAYAQTAPAGFVDWTP